MFPQAHCVPWWCWQALQFIPQARGTGIYCHGSGTELEVLIFSLAAYFLISFHFLGTCELLALITWNLQQQSWAAPLAGNGNYSTKLNLWLSVFQWQTRVQSWPAGDGPSQAQRRQIIQINDPWVEGTHTLKKIRNKSYPTYFADIPDYKKVQLPPRGQIA